MSANLKAWTFIVGFATAGICAGPVFAALPTHGAVLHLDSGLVPITPPLPFMETTYGADNLLAPLNGYHWEIEITNRNAIAGEVFNMTIEIQTPAGTIEVDAGTANVPPASGPVPSSLYWEYYLNPDPFGEIAPLAVRMTYQDPNRLGAPALDFETSITEDPMPAVPPCPPKRTPPFPRWIPAPGAAPDVGEVAGDAPGIPQFTFTLMLPGSDTQPGDENGDGKVDAADYVTWLKMDGTLGGYADWRSNFGETGGFGAALGASSNAVAVPEPASVLLLLLAAAAGATPRRRHGLAFNVREYSTDSQ